MKYAKETKASYRIKPKIFVPEEKGNPLTDTLVEFYDNYDIFWFCWLYDGSRVLMTPDYEPIIMIYKEDNLGCLITRRHWAYRPYNLEDHLKMPIEILFERWFHPPLPKTEENQDIFEIARIKQGLVPIDYEPKEIKSLDIPKKFRTGEGHITNLLGSVEDPCDVARYIYDLL